MLKEIRLDDIPKSNALGCMPTPNGLFAEETLLEFATSDMMIAEVSGWPDGEPTNSKQTSKYVSLLKNKIEKHKIANITALQRGNRIFLQKLVIKRTA